MSCNKYLSLVTVGIMSLVSCNNSPNSQSGNVTDHTIKKGITLDSTKWKCKVISTDVICYPNNWKELNQDKFFFFSYLNNNDSETFFVVNRLNEKEIKMDVNGYLKEVYRQLTADTIELCEGYTLKELTFQNNRKAYYGEFFSKKHGRSFFTRSFFLTYNSFIYDITLKVNERDRVNYSDIFQNILYNIKSSNKHLFDEKDLLRNVRDIDLSN